MKRKKTTLNLGRWACFVRADDQPKCLGICVKLTGYLCFACLIAEADADADETTKANKGRA